MKRVFTLLLAALMLSALVSCRGGEKKMLINDGVLRIGMECTYAPYNWTQTDDSNGAVPISNVKGAYANGYDVMIAKRICDANGWKLEIVSTDWDSLCPGIQSGSMDANIAGQSMTADRLKEVDMAGPYYYADIVVLTRKDSKYASATSIADLAGGKGTAQSGTIWYQSCLPQIKDCDLGSPAESAPAMIMALQSKRSISSAQTFPPHARRLKMTTALLC